MNALVSRSIAALATGYFTVGCQERQTKLALECPWIAHRGCGMLNPCTGPVGWPRDCPPMPLICLALPSWNLLQVLRASFRPQVLNASDYPSIGLVHYNPGVLKYKLHQGEGSQH